MNDENRLQQEELDRLLLINGFLAEPTDTNRKNLIDEIQDAILDSGKLSISEWVALRDRLKVIERLIPHIDLIIDLKSGRRR
jgi:hypothetical protein